ncbi:MAG: subtype B tannase [Eubacteriales bacterium]|nr:subtype B tannase [Eubacteriales bacterium]
MKFDKNQYTVEELSLEGETIRFRAFRNLVYVEYPVDAKYQRMNIFVPECYYEDKSVNGYTLNSAPVFMPNQVGGYMPGELAEPGVGKHGKNQPNSIFRALQHGYVVAAPAIRGRTQKDENGVFTGKAPACVIDYKAAVRYLHYFSDELPGDESKIITNGTSAGGALSALMGASGNHPDYAGLLKDLGAADAGDGIFAASCYCPITNLEHADMAYEWQFQGVNEYYRRHMQMDEGGRPALSRENGRMTEEQIQTSADEAALFPEYVNSLGLKDADGNDLVLDENGDGTFKEYVESVILASAQKALEEGMDIADKTWLTIKGGKVTGMDFSEYVREITRMKTAPAFDALSMDSAENSLFGNAASDCCHFTDYSMKHSKTDGRMADLDVIRMLNPMNYIDDEKADTAKYWRIRHGECDRDTSLAISAILAVRLQSAGCKVDYQSPWNVPHSGDYDLEELFAWIDGMCKITKREEEIL